ncbi:MAG: coproporphyrinogen III oxidase family protein, partial [Ktedonobacteraceae bacterium]
MTQTHLPALAEMLETTPYVAYTYSYPHKTTYRRFPEPLRLADLWVSEQRDTLSLYIHVPFCEMRCGFCNLFTTIN